MLLRLRSTTRTIHRSSALPQIACASIPQCRQDRRYGLREPFLFSLVAEWPIRVHAARRRCYGQLYKPPRPDEVDEAELCISFFTSMHWRRALHHPVTKRDYVLVTASQRTVLKQLRSKLLFRSEARERAVTWKGFVTAFLHQELSIDGKTPKLAHQANVPFKEHFFGIANLEPVRLISGFPDSIAPSYPIPADPVGLLDARFMEESLSTECHAPVSCCRSLDLRNNVRLIHLPLVASLGLR